MPMAMARFGLGSTKTGVMSSWWWGASMLWGVFFLISVYPKGMNILNPFRDGKIPEVRHTNIWIIYLKYVSMVNIYIYLFILYVLSNSLCLCSLQCTWRYRWYLCRSRGRLNRVEVGVAWLEPHLCDRWIIYVGEKGVGSARGAGGDQVVLDLLRLVAERGRSDRALTLWLVDRVNRGGGGRWCLRRHHNRLVRPVRFLTS